MTDKEILEHYGWKLVCESPLEIKKGWDDFASGEAAELVIDWLTKHKAKEDEIERKLDAFGRL